MRITRRQLRQIIKEELMRNLNEEDFFSYEDAEAEDIADFGRDMQKFRDAEAIKSRLGDETTDAAMKMPAAMSRQVPAALGQGAALIPAMNAVRKELGIADAVAIAKMIKDPATNKVLSDVYTGKTVLRRGSSGPAVMVYQTVILANLMMWLKSHRGIESAITPMSAEAIARKAISTGGNITDEELRAGVEDLLTLGDFEPDGNYGPKTEAAVALLQVIMDRKQIIASAGEGGAEIQWDGLVDGILGRQTAMFLAGFTRLGAITGAAVKSDAAAAGGILQPTGVTLQERRRRRF